MAGFSSALRSRNVSFTPGIDFVELEYKRECERKNVVERLAWEIVGDRCRLKSLNYSVLAPGD